MYHNGAMKKPHIALFFLILISLFSVSSKALAQQVESVNTHLFRFSDTLETVTIEDAMGPQSEMVRDGRKVMLRASYDYINEPLIAIDESRSTEIYDLVNDLHTVTVGGGFFLAKKLWLGVSVPLHYIELANPYAVSDPTSWKFGDMPVYIKWRLTGDQSKINVALMPYVHLPLGNAEYLVTDNGWSWGAKLLMDRAFSKFNLYSTLGFTYAKDAVFLTVDRSKRLELGGGTYLPLIRSNNLINELGLNVEANWSFTVVNVDADQNPLDFRVGMRGKIKSTAVFAGIGFSGAQQARSGKIGAYVGVKLPFGSNNAPVVAKQEEPKPVEIVNPVVEDVEPMIVAVKTWKKNIEVERTILFKTSSATIDPQSYPELDSAVATISPYIDQISSVTIHGHTDSIGAAESNLKLSQARAASVKNYLVGKGIPETKLKPLGHGENQLKVTPELTIKDKAMNRRVEFEVKEIITGTTDK